MSDEQESPSAWPNSLPDWKKTDKWKPARAGGGSQGFQVENPDAERLGHGKPKYVPQEILGYRFADLVGVAVPRVELGVCEGEVIAVSHLWGAKSLDVPTIRRLEDSQTEELKAALRSASGLLVYHSWVGTSDLKDPHVLVRPGDRENSYEVAYIDFASAFSWKEDAWGDVRVPPKPPSLVNNRDVEVIEATLSRIEGVGDEEISDVVSSLPSSLLTSEEEKRIITGLQKRRDKLRATYEAEGWIATTKGGSDGNG